MCKRESGEVVLAHRTAVEAALGHPSDHGERQHLRPAIGDQGVTEDDNPHVSSHIHTRR